MVPKGSKYSLKGFIVEKISMSHIYQPAMLKVLLEKVLPFVAPVSVRKGMHQRCGLLRPEGIGTGTY